MNNESSGSRSSASDHTPAGRSVLIVVPRARVDLYTPLKRSFDEEANVEVILDRRFRDRRARPSARDPERRRQDRRRRSRVDADVKAGKWVTVPPSRPDFGDPDTQAILFLCCAEHVVECRSCRMTYRLRWLPCTEAGGYSCPRCSADLTPAVLAHTQTCWYWASPGSSAKNGREDPPVAANGPLPG